MVAQMKVANIEQELVIIPNHMKDDVSEASHVQIFIDIMMLYIGKQYNSTEETAGAYLCNSFHC